MGGLAVGLGAFGAHGLREVLESHGRASTFETAVQYHFYHTFALLVTGILMAHFPPRMLQRAALAFTTGIVIFSGSLYILSLTGLTWLGAITPVGGVLFVAGWLLLFFGLRNDPK